MTFLKSLGNIVVALANGLSNVLMALIKGLGIILGILVKVFKSLKPRKNVKEIKPGGNLTTFIMGLLFNIFLTFLCFIFVPHPAHIPATLVVWIYFGYFGLIETKIQHARVPTFLGRRIPRFLFGWFLLKEGLNWMLPRPIMNGIEVDLREKPMQIELTEVLSNDNIPVKIDIGAQLKIIDPYMYLSVENPEQAFRELVERTTRWQSNNHNAMDLPGQQKKLSEDIEKESDKVTKSRWGLDVAQIFVTDIRLPEEIEKATARIQIEKAQREAEIFEIDTLSMLINKMHSDTKIDPKECLISIQAEREKRTIINVEGSAGDFTKGSVAGATLKGGHGGSKRKGR